MESVRDFILNYLQQEYTFPADTDVSTINYISDGYISSLAVVKFVVELEDEYNIVFSDEELSGPDFKIVGELIKLVEEKVD